MHWRQIAIVAMATALNALDGFDVLSIAFASPGIVADWHVDKASLGVVLSMELAGMSVGALALGALADRAGRRPTILLCLVVMASGMALASVAADVVALSAVRFYTGIGIGGMIAAINAVVAESVSARRRNLSIAFVAAGYPMGAIIGGSVASVLLADTGQWQAIFEFGACASATFIPLVFWLIPETIPFLQQREPRGALERINRALARFGREGLDRLPARTESEALPRIRELFAPGLGGITILLSLVYLLHIMTFYFLMKWIPQVVSDMGFTAAAAAGVLVWANVGGAVGSIMVSLAINRFGVRRLVIAAMICGSLAISGFGQDLPTLHHLSAAAAVGAFFATGAVAGLYAVLAQSFPTRLRGSGIGLVLAVARGGAALGPITAGVLLAGGWPFHWVAPAMALGSLAAAALLGLGLPRVTRARRIVNAGP